MHTSLTETPPLTGLAQWACYKGLSVWVQSRLDPCPKHDDDERWQLLYSVVTVTLDADTCHWRQVLVDVPCYTDRHVVAEDVNNLFLPNRVAERLQLPERQQALL